MSKNKIVVFDDEKRFTNQYRKRLESIKTVKKSFEVEIIDDELFEDAIIQLQTRQKELRSKKQWTDTSIFDDTSILFIDYDLIKAFKFPMYLTGEVVAYLARCFSECGLIIGLNQFGVNPFDLTLKGHMESFADLNIGVKQLDIPGLWGDMDAKFRPWNWPALPKYLEKFDKRIERVKEDITKPVFPEIGIEKIVNLMPRSVSEFIKTKKAKITFEWFVKNSGNGLRGRRDRHITNDMVARIAAARISKWFERLVLPGQDIVIDAPHLVSRYPSLLKGKQTKIDTWNKTTRFSSHEKLGIDNEKIERYRFKKEEWLSRPVWFWNELSQNSDIQEVKSPWEKKISNFVFCEDASWFFDKKLCRQFLCNTDSPYIYRYIKYFEDIEYRPRVRLI